MSLGGEKDSVVHVSNGRPPDIRTENFYISSYRITASSFARCCARTWARPPKTGDRGSAERPSD